MKTARFADVVKASGTPETYLLWMPAAKDPVFQRALKEHRILTLHQELRGAKKDYGLVGFHEEPNAQFIIFPKSLKRFGEKRIIGIDYELFAKDSRSAAAPHNASRNRPTAPVKRSQAAESHPRDAAANLVEFTPPPLDGATAGERGARRSAETRRTSGRNPAGAKAVKAPQTRVAEQPAATPRAGGNRITAELAKALKELRAGKSVVAYERLEKLQRELQTGSDLAADE